MLEHIFKLEERILLNAVSLAADVSLADDILVISHKDYDDLAKAVYDHINMIEYNSENGNTEDLFDRIEEMANENTTKIGFALHGDEVAGLINENFFDKALGELVPKKGGRIDIISCKLWSEKLETDLEKLTGRNVAMSDDDTSNSGDWILESEKPFVDLTNIDQGYFDKYALEDFSGSFGANPLQLDNGTGKDFLQLRTEAQVSPNGVLDFGEVEGGMIGFYVNNTYQALSQDTQDRGSIRIFIDGVNDASKGFLKLNLVDADTYKYQTGNYIIVTKPISHKTFNSISDDIEYHPNGYDGDVQIKFRFDVDNSKGPDIPASGEIAINIKIVAESAVSTDTPLFDAEHISDPANNTIYQSRTIIGDHSEIALSSSELPNIEPIDIYGGMDGIAESREAVSTDIKSSSIVRAAEFDMNTKFFIETGTEEPGELSDISSGLIYNDSSMLEHTFLTSAEQSSVVYLKGEADNTYDEAKKTSADADILRRAAGGAELSADNYNIASESAAYRIKIGDDIYNIALQYPIEYTETRMNFSGELTDGGSLLIEDEFLLEQLEQMIEKGRLNNFKRITAP